MRVKTQDYNAVTVVELQGDLDSDSVGLFQNVIMGILSANKIAILLDMSNVSFIDSEGLERLLWARDYCNENKRQLRLAGLDESCAKILEITRLCDEFDCHAELSEAVKSFV